MVRWGNHQRDEYKDAPIAIPWMKPSITSAPASRNTIMGVDAFLLGLRIPVMTTTFLFS